MRKKEFLAGMATMLLLVAMVVTVAAKTGTVTQDLIYNNIGITLDGKRLDLTDANGNSVEPFMFNGTNYLPVRAISEALGLDVAWDSATSTIVLTSKSEEPQNKNKPIDELLFAKESVRFYYTGYEKTEDGYQINLRVENDSDYKITGRIGPDSVAGNKKTYMVLTCDTEPGRTSEGKITISNEDMNKAGVDDFKSIRVSFMIHDTQNLPYELDFSTGFITIRLEK